MPWRCDDCGRTFGRKNQSHTCEPVDPKKQNQPFSDRPAEQRRACEAVLRHVKKLGPVTIEVVTVGVLVRAKRTFVELRPKRDCLALSFILPERIDDARIVRVIEISPQRVAHFVELRHPSDVDRDVKDWVAASYFALSE